MCASVFVWCSAFDFLSLDYTTPSGHFSLVLIFISIILLLYNLLFFFHRQYFVCVSVFGSNWELVVLWASKNFFNSKQPFISHGWIDLKLSLFAFLRIDVCLREKKNSYRNTLACWLLCVCMCNVVSIHIKIQIHLLHYKLYTKYIRAHITHNIKQICMNLYM